MTHVDAEVAPSRLVTWVDVAAAAQLACLLEASAPKPGNVSPGRHFADTRYEDFLASAAAIGGPFAGAGERGVGATVRLAIEATRRWTASNTNLGIVLLLAPLARAVSSSEPRNPSPGSRASIPDPRVPDPESSIPDSQSPSPEPPLRLAVRRVLDTTTVDDARDVYAAIRLAAPGGLGKAETEDVADEPSVTLLEAMCLSAHRDGIAREYATAFDVTFEVGAPALQQARQDGLSWDDAVVETFLTVLAASPDTHIARRAGDAVARDVSERARQVLSAGGVRSEEGREAIDRMDRALRDPRNARNPGTTADLTAAALFVVLLQGCWT